jgi:sarcosine oxidase
MGSASLAHCAMRGARVLGIEQFEELHDLGASSGKTRIIRQAYFEDAAYVPLVLRAYDLWRELEASSGTQLLALVGVLLAGSERSEVISGSLHAARAHDLHVEYLDAADMRRRFPTLRVHAGEVGVFEPLAGAIFPERAIRAHLDLARARGAQTRFRTALKSWESDERGVKLDLSDGSRIRTRSLILTIGPWFAAAMQQAGVRLEVQRNAQVWFAPQSRAYRAPDFPAFLIDRPQLPAPLYGFPDFGDGVKAAFHGVGAITTPSELVREIDPVADVAPVAAALEAWMPGAASRYIEGKACMYALTPDRHFVVDRDPRDSRVILCGGFSGHGFKFASAIGEVASQLALDGGTPHDVRFLSLQRFTPH